MGLLALCSIGLQPVALDTGFDIASVLSEEAHQTDSANDRADCFEGDAWRASGSDEDLGTSSVVERLCVWVAEDSRVEGGPGSRIGGQGFARGSSRNGGREAAGAEVPLHHGLSPFPYQ